jgi:hypothetical protein
MQKELGSVTIELLLISSAADDQIEAPRSTAQQL